MSPMQGSSTGDLLYTNAERASLNEHWDSPPLRCSFLGAWRTQL